MRSKTVALLALAPNPAHPHGVATYTAPLAESLAQSGLEVNVWAQQAYAHEQAGSERANPVWRPGLLLGFDLAREVWRTRPDTLHVQFEFGIYGGVLGLISLLLGLAISRAAFRQRTVVTCHQVLARSDVNADTLRLLGVRLPSWAARIALRFLVAALARCADQVIVHCDAFRDRLVAEWGAPSHLVHVVPHGVPQTNRRGSPDANRVLVFGHIKPYKGIEIAIEAFRRVAREFPEWKLTIAGKAASNGYLEELQALARPLGAQVEFIGCVEEREAGEVMQRAAIMLLPYRTLFSASGPMAHAIGYHVPFVISESLRPLSPDWPFWCEPSIDHWASTLRRLMGEEDLRAHARTLARRLSEQRSWPVVAARTAEIYLSSFQR